MLFVGCVLLTIPYSTSKTHSLKGQYELTHVSGRTVVVTTLATGARTALKSGARAFGGPMLLLVPAILMHWRL
jgi:hypothetical protein